MCHPSHGVIVLLMVSFEASVINYWPMMNIDNCVKVMVFASDLKFFNFLFCLEPLVVVPILISILIFEFDGIPVYLISG